MSLSIIPPAFTAVQAEQNEVEIVYRFNIPRSDAATALNLLAQQTDSVIAFSYEQAQQFESNALYGYFTLAKALHYLLQGSGLEATSAKNGGVRIAIKQAEPEVAAEEPPVVTAEPVTEAPIPYETIEVAGIRKSLHRALDVKKQSDYILDAIVAEDIGKLPDVTTAESIARVPGVQVARFNDEATAVTIRGLPYFATTYNSREIFTAELRRMQLQDMPAHMLARIEVFKPGTVDVIEPGVAGIVNAVTRRPFDHEDRLIGGGALISYNDQSQITSPNANFLFSDRWQTALGEMG
ncbi:MAG: TonB-dependent receptor plug domain-containing protein, partial [Pseudomonadota bacterium]|nr:TonB-dependent receptor plug domain-containing protein [Pseudomonadota bacterium]